MTRVCGLAGCPKKHLARDLCAMHYARLRTHGDPGPAEPYRKYGRTGCEVEDCDRDHGANGLCHRHRKQAYRFDLTADDLSDLSDECPICGSEATHVDHCHDCGEIRGALCHGCNAGNGITDSPDLLEAKARWLRGSCRCYTQR